MATRPSPARSAPPTGQAWRRPALLVAHPGHELRVFHWLEVARPRVYVLTDGSGSDAVSRLASTTALLTRTGATEGRVYGAYSDRALYALLLERRVREATALLERLVADLAAAEIDAVVADAAEGYNPAHDLARMLAGAAVEVLRRRTGRAPQSLEFPLTGLPDPDPERPGDGCVRLTLTDADLERKIAVARGYQELAAELAAVAKEHGLEAFRRECLRPATRRAGFDGPAERPPYYETYGEQQVAAGRYAEVLRWEEHVRPVADALWAHAERGA
jgi:hypothetical protein